VTPGLPSIETRLQNLEDIEAIKRLMYKYWRCLDQKIWAELPDCFAEDVIADYGMPEWRKVGRQTLTDFLYGHDSSPEFQISHAGHNPEVTLLGPDTAQGYFKLHDWVVIGGATVMRGFGQYDNRFARRDGRWQIQHLNLHYTYREEQRVYVSNQRVLATEAMLNGE